MKLYLDELRKIRKSHKLTIQEVAQKLGVNRMTLNAWETGKRVPSEANIRMLAKILEVTVDKISDLEAEKEISNVQFSKAVESWLSMSNVYIDKTSKNEFDILISGIAHIKKKVSDTKLIINALKTSTNSMFYIKDTSHKYIIANSVFLETLSLNRNFNVLNKVDEDFFPAIEAKENDEQDSQVLISGKTFRKEGFIPGTRKKKWGIISKIPILDNKGKIQGIMCSFFDITERKISERKRELLETNINLMRDTVTIRNYDLTKCIYLNKAYESIYGYQMEKFKEQDFFLSCVHPDDREKEIQYCKDLSWPEVSIFRAIRSDEKIIWIERYYNKITISDHTYHFFIDTDITESKERQSYIEDFNEAIIASGDVVWIARNKNKDKGTIIYEYLSDNTENIFGINSREINEKPFCWLECVHPLDRKRVKNWIKHKKFPKEIEFRVILPKNKKKWIHSRVCEKDRAYYGILYDITASKEKEFISKIFEKFLHSVNDVTWVFKYPHELVYYTGAPEKLYGRKIIGKKELLKIWHNEVLHNDSKDEYEKLVQYTKYQIKNITKKYKNPDYKFVPKMPDKFFVYKAIKPDGSFSYIESRSTFIFYEEEIYYIIVDRDITESFLKAKKLDKINSLLKDKDKLTDTEKQILYLTEKESN